MEVCDCSLCPEYSPAEPPAFEACGGEPFGQWRLLSADYSGFQQLRTDGSSCPLHGTAIVADNDLRIELESGGAAEFAQDVGEIEYRAETACLPRCEGLSGQDASFSCKSNACGTCDCSVKTDALARVGTWTRSETTLTLDLGDYRLAYDYCANAQTLALRSIDGVVVTLERVTGVGMPTPCDSRTLEECTSGGGCSVGLCEGEGKCGGAPTESACTVIQDCSWNTQRCAGAPSAVCSFSGYDQTPGCKFVKTVQHCEGSLPACEGLSEEPCDQTAGCRYDAACFGCEFTTGCLSTEKPCKQLDIETCFDSPYCDVVTD